MKKFWERYGVFLLSFILFFCSFILCDIDVLQAASSVNYQSPLIDFGVGMFCFLTANAGFIFGIADIISRRIKRRRKDLDAE